MYRLCNYFAHLGKTGQILGKLNLNIVKFQFQVELSDVLTIDLFEYSHSKCQKVPLKISHFSDP